MPLGENSYPFVEGDKTLVMDPDTGQRYEIDNNGQVITPGGVEVPPWGAPTPSAQPKPTPTAQQQPGFTPYSPQVPSLPGLDVQPGMGAQQWEAQYNLTLAQVKQLRELMETVTQPQAKAAIDQAIQALRQQTFQGEMQARESQASMTGKVPAWLPQPPRFQPGAYQQYETGGLVSGPGAGGGTAVSEDQAAQAIWENDKNMQSMYAGKNMTPVQAVRDWWSWAPHEGATSIPEYAQKKGWT